MASVQVEYDDGRVEEIRITPRGIVAAERKWPKDMPRTEGGIFAAWNSAGKPGGGFDAWLDSIVEFSLPDPTTASLPATLPEGSPDSLPTPG